MKETKIDPKHAILVAVQTPDSSEGQVQQSLDELEQLVEGLGMPILARFVQKRAKVHPSTYVGEGKLQEISVATGGSGEVAKGPKVKKQGRNPTSDFLIVADDELTGAQIRNLEMALDAEVADRSGIILRVFEARAKTREARLEIELAKLTYEQPRIRDDVSMGDREGGGGRASRGHSNVELAKQRSRERMAEIRRELEQIQVLEESRIRARGDTFRVALVGYTNAGKSSLMRLMTGSEVLVEDKLFATLGTTTRQLVPPATPAVVITDTVGFINRLPHELIASFRSTLAEAREASLILQVVDASDPNWWLQLTVTADVLRDLGIGDTPLWVVFNKVDRLTATERSALKADMPDAIQLSALDKGDGAKLRERLIAFQGTQLVAERLTIPYTKQGILAEFRQRLQVVKEEYDEALVVHLRGSPAVLASLKARLSG